MGTSGGISPMKLFGSTTAGSSNLPVPFGETPNISDPGIENRPMFLFSQFLDEGNGK
jgi:hypothetical protein